MPYSFPVDFKNCQKPLAPALEVALRNPLSATAKYLKSSGIPSCFSIGSITGEYSYREEGA